MNSNLTNRWVLGVCVAAFLAACGNPNDGPDEPDDPAEEETVGTGLAGAEATALVTAPEPNLSAGLTSEEIFTFAPGYIEIDRLSGGTSTDFGDANLFRFDGTAAQLAACTTGNGADPADGTCDSRLPTAKLAPCTDPTQLNACSCTGDADLDTDTCLEIAFTDWNNLLTDANGDADPVALSTHRLLDAVKTDGSSFKNGSCVEETKVLGKMDLTAGAITNNTEYSYLALKRFDNNGDAGYSWLFTAITPQKDPAFGSCAEGGPLVYTLTAGDVLINGNFNPSSGAALVVRRVSAAADGLQLLAQDVVDQTATTAGQPVWEDIPGDTNLGAVNTTDTSAGVLEVIDGTDQAGNRTDKNAISGSPGSYEYAENLFAEAAVDFAVFTGGGGSLCDAKFFGSVITQPSSSKTSDLKDLLGPQLFNFGSLSVEASVSPSCSKEIEYDVSQVTAPGVDTTDPDSVAGLICEWTFTHDDGTVLTANDCSGTLELDPADPTGSYDAELFVAIGAGLSCTTTQSVGSVEVFEPLGASATATPTCGLAFDYSGAATGGSPTTTATWTFGTVDDGTSVMSGTINVDSAGPYTAELTVEDDRGDIFCSASASDDVTVDESLSIDAELTATCGLEFDYDVLVSGGIGGHTTDWQFSSSDGTPSPASSGSGSGSVSVDAAGEYGATVTVSEDRGDGVTCSQEETLSVKAYDPLVVVVTLDETCTTSFDYDSLVTGGSPDLEYSWSFPGAGVVPDATDQPSGTVDVDSAGNYSAALTVTDQRTDASCSAEDSAAIDVFAPLVATAEMTATCNLSFDYIGTIEGGSPAAISAWVFDVGVTDLSPGTPTGSASVGAAGLYGGSFNVTDTLRNGVLCQASDTAEANPFAPLAVMISPDNTTQQCSDGPVSDAVTYTASPSGGNGNYAYTWSGCTSDIGGDCVIDPSDSAFCVDATVQVTLSDDSGLCASEDSEEENYSKVTIIQASNN